MDLAVLSRVLEELQLSLTRIEEWILIQRATFDLRIDEEPYHSIQMYASLATKKFVVRVWGRSCHYGEFTNEEDLKVHCIINFKNTAACVGYLGSHPGGGIKLVHVNFPCPRWIAKCCDVTFEQNSEKMIIGLCASCSSTADSAAVKQEEMPKGASIYDVLQIVNFCPPPFGPTCLSSNLGEILDTPPPSVWTSYLESHQRRRRRRLKVTNMIFL